MLSFKKNIFRIFFCTGFVLVSFFILSCQSAVKFPLEDSCEFDGEIYLLGEVHGFEDIYRKEISLYETYYGQGVRDFFIESGYCAAELLNLWMKSDDDEFLDVMFGNLEGTLSFNDGKYSFLKTIKKYFPETVFHGVDVEHEYASTGKYYLDFLAKNGCTRSEYDFAESMCRQGEIYYSMKCKASDEYREKSMTENFLRQLSLLGDKNVFGIFGSFHTAQKIVYSHDVVPLAVRLGNYFAGRIYATDLSKIQLIFGRRFYNAEYFYEENISDGGAAGRRTFYILEGYSPKDFKRFGRSGKVFDGEILGSVKRNSVFAVEYTDESGESVIEVYVFEGKKVDGKLTAFGIM